MDCSMQVFPVLHHIPEFAQTHVHWVGDVIQPSHPLLSPLLLPSIFPSIRIFSNESALRIRWPKYWSFSFSISPSNEYSGLISFWIDWFACSPRVSQEASPTPQFKNINSSMLNLHKEALISIHDYWKTIAFTRQTFVCKAMCLLFNMLSRLVITFLTRSKHLLISWWQSPPAVIFGAQENKVCHRFYCVPIYLPWSDETGCHDLKFFQCWVLSQLFHSPLSLS